MPAIISKTCISTSVVSEPALVVPAPPFKSVIVQPFAHGQEGDLVEIAKNITAKAELWITGNDDAAGIGALGVASCIIAESPEYKIYSVLFEDHSLDNDARGKAVHDSRRNSLLLEQHMKITKDGEVFVRRLVHGGAEVKDAVIPAASITESGAVSAYFPPALGPSEIEIAVEALGTEVNASPQPALTVVGRIKSTGCCHCLSVPCGRCSRSPRCSCLVTGWCRLYRCCFLDRLLPCILDWFGGPRLYQVKLNRPYPRRYLSCWL